MIKTMKIKEDTHKKLCEIGRKEETFDKIINGLIDKYNNRDIPKELSDSIKKVRGLRDIIRMKDHTIEELRLEIWDLKPLKTSIVD